MKYNDLELWRSYKSIARSKNCLQQRLDYMWNGEKCFIPQYTKLSKVTTIAGAGSDKSIRVVDQLIEKHGGTAETWKKQAGQVSSQKYIFDIHWYESDDGIQHEVKLKYRKDKGK